MLFFALTNSPVSNTLTGNQIQTHLGNGMYLTMVSDEFFSHITETDTKITIRESIHFGEAKHVENGILSEIIYYLDQDTVQIYKPTISGRPLYYHLNNSGNFYCSSHISVLRNTGIPIEENKEALPEFFVYRFVQPPRSIYKNVNQVNLGEKLVFQVADHGVVLRQSKKYEPPLSITNHLEEREIIQKTLHYLSEAVSVLRDEQQHLGILLSGGLDSSILFQLLSNQYNLRKSYSTSYPFEDPDNDTEKEYAFSAAQAFGSDHHYSKISIDEYLFDLIEAIQAAEEPVHHLQSVLFYSIFKNSVSDDETVIVSGEGADSNFGASTHNALRRSKELNHHLFWKIISDIPKLDSLSRRVGRGSGIVKALKMMNNGWFPIDDPGSPVWNIQRYGDQNWVCDYFNVDPIDIMHSRYKVLRPFENRPIEDVIALRALFSTQVTHSIWSKIAESQGKKIYYPFYSNDLLDFVYSIPWEIKNQERKHVLRKVAEELHIPEFIIRRPKSGMGLHPKRWAVRGAGLDPLIPIAAKVTDESLIRKFQSGNLNSAMTYWNFLNYGIWKRLIIDEESLDTLKSELQEELMKASTL